MILVGLVLSRARNGPQKSDKRDMNLQSQLRYFWTSFEDPSPEA